MVSLHKFDPQPSIRLSQRSLMEKHRLSPSIVLETCDRLEVYQGDGPIEPSVLEHLARVASGLESPLLGEKAILGQVRSAYNKAQIQQPLSGSLHKLFQTAIHIARIVRSETGIDQGASSHAQCVMNLLREHKRPELNEVIALIGINKLNEDMLAWLTSHGCSHVILSNRDLDKAQSLAKTYGIQARALNSLPSLLNAASVVISCTSAPHFMISQDQVRNLPSLDFPRLYIDLAVPHDIDPACASIPGIRLYDLTEIEKRQKQTLQTRHMLATKAQARIIDLVRTKLGGRHG